MPTYTYQCPTCLRESTGIRRIADRHNGPVCDCGTPQELMITACGFVAPDWNFEGYKCVATGKEINSESERKQVMAENGLADAREFGEPDFDQMKEDRKAMHDSANAPLPADLEAAIKREGLDNIL